MAPFSAKPVLKVVGRCSWSRSCSLQATIKIAKAIDIQIADAIQDRTLNRGTTNGTATTFTDRIQNPADSVAKTIVNGMTAIIIGKDMHSQVPLKFPHASFVPAAAPFGPSLLIK